MSQHPALSRDRADAALLDEEVWDSPARLTAAELFAHAGTGRCRGDFVPDDPEDDR